MSIYIGGQKYGIHVGSQKIKEAYVGSTKVYSSDTPLTLLYEYLPEFSDAKSVNLSFCKSGWSSSRQSLYSKIVLEYKIKNGADSTTSSGAFRYMNMVFGDNYRSYWNHYTYTARPTGSPITKYATVRALDILSDAPTFSPADGIVKVTKTVTSLSFDIYRESSEIPGGNTAYKAFKLVLHLPTSHTGNSAINLTDCEIWTTDSNGDYYLAGTGELDLGYRSTFGYGFAGVAISTSSSTVAKQTVKDLRVYGG